MKKLKDEKKTTLVKLQERQERHRNNYFGKICSFSISLQVSQSHSSKRFVSIMQFYVK
jgi:hypothetical protein